MFFVRSCGGRRPEVVSKAHLGAKSNKANIYPQQQSAEVYLGDADMQKFLRAIHIVESGGRIPAPAGDGGRSIGPLQIG